MRLSPGSFNPRNSEVWWNCLKSAVSIIDMSDERHRHCVLFGRSLTLHLAVASLKNIWQANQPIRRSVESHHIGGLRSRDRAQEDIKRKKFHHCEVLANHNLEFHHTTLSENRDSRVLDIRASEQHGTNARAPIN